MGRRGVVHQCRNLAGQHSGRDMPERGRVRAGFLRSARNGEYRQETQILGRPFMASGAVRVRFAGHGNSEHGAAAQATILY